MIRPLRPLRKRSPFIGAPPGLTVAPPARRPRPILVVAAASALLPRPPPLQPKIGLPHRPNPPGPVAGSLRTVRVIGGRGRVILPVVPGTGTAVVVTAGPVGLRTARLTSSSPVRPAGTVLLSRPARPVVAAAPSPARLRPLIARAESRAVRGAGLVTRVPARTQRLGAFQVEALVVRRDERRSPGALWQSAPHRPTLRLPAGQLEPLVVRRDERGYRGAVFIVRVPARTVRLSAEQTTALVRLRPYPEPRRGAVWLSPPHRPTLPPPAGFRPPEVVRRDERRCAGAVFLGAPHRPTPPFVPPRSIVARRDERRYAGFLWRSGPHRPNPVISIVRPKPALVARRDEGRGGWEAARGLVLISHPERLTPPFVPPVARVIRRDERRYAGSVSLGAPHRPTFILTAGETRAQVVRRDQRCYAGAVLFTGPHRATFRLAAFQTEALIVRRDERRFAGRVFVSRLPARTVRLAPPQTTIAVIRRDERRFAGRIIIQPPSRTGAAVIVPRTPRHVIVRRDERAFAGRIISNRVPGRTVRLTGEQLTATVVRRDERRGAGSVWQSGPHRPTALLTAGETRALVVRRDQRGFNGRIWISGPHRPLVVAPVRSALIVRLASVYPPVRAPLLVRPARATFRLPAGRLTALVAFRQHPRPAGTPGRILFVRPVRPRVVPRLPKLLLVRRDERGTPGQVLRLPVSRANATVITHGNPRAVVVLRARPGAVVTLRSRPTATLTLRRPSATLKLIEG